MMDGTRYDLIAELQEWCDGCCESFSINATYSLDMCRVGVCPAVAMAVFCEEDE